MNKKDVLKLKKLTHAGLLDCHQALKESDGDFEKAVLWLRKKGRKIAAQRVDKATDQGAIFAKANSDSNFGVILALGCETDFVALNHLFIELGNTLLKVALENKCTHAEDLLKLQASGSTMQELLTHTSATLGEHIVITRYDTLSDGLVSAYVHTGRRIGGLVSLNATPDASLLEVGKNMAVQVVVSNPLAVDIKSMDPAILVRETMIIEERVKKENKPQAILDKIAKGRLEAFINETTLLPQPFVKDDTKSVEDYLKGISAELKITGFKRFFINT